MNMHSPVIAVPDRYDAALTALVPLNEPEHIRRFRKRLLAARDLATRGLCNCTAHTDQALSLFEIIVQVATAHVFRLHDLGGLEDAANLCLRLLGNASTLDRMGGFDAQSN
ncbi:MAG: hypothetical protein ABIO85_03755 [Sphingomicrobium sp.]